MRGAGVVVCLGRHDRARGRRDQDARLGAGHVRQPERRLARPRRRVGRPAWSGGAPAARHVTTARAAERVHLITATVAMDGSLLDAAVGAGADGHRRRGDRRGQHGPGPAGGGGPRDGRRDPGRSGHPLSGRPGGDRLRLPGRRRDAGCEAGAIPVGQLCAVKARVALALGLGAGLDRDGLTALLADPAGPV